jgi:hypothetical protein
MEEWLKLSKHSTVAKVDAMRYRSIISGLWYLTHTWPDIAFAVGYVSWFMEDPHEDHRTTVKSCCTTSRGCSIKRSSFPSTEARVAGLRLTVFSEAPPKTEEGELELTVFSDANMAGNIDGRRSTSSVLVFLGVAPIAWQSLKQKIVALSTCEAEFVAAATAACQAV